MSYMYYYPVQDEGPGVITTPERHHSDSSGNLVDSVDIARGGDITRYIYSIADSKVIEVRNGTPDDTRGEWSTGNCVVAQIIAECELKGKYVTYMHMLNNSNTHLKIGTVVPRGAIIGKVGNTGDSDGAHLHIDIRSGNWSGQGQQIGAFDWKNSTYRVDKNELIGVTDQLFRGLTPKKFAIVEPTTGKQFKDSTDFDIREMCTIAIKEAQILGEAGMNEVCCVVYNRLCSDRFPNTVYDIISANNQFSPYAENPTLFDTGGLPKSEIPSQLWNTAKELLINGKYPTNINQLVKKAYYFRSDELVKSDYLFTRSLGGFCHHYNGINMWS